MVLNMGPQHPSTHGVLRVVLELGRRAVIKCIPQSATCNTASRTLSE